MDKIVIDVKDLSKKFPFGQKRKHDTLRDEIAGAFKNTASFFRDRNTTKLETGEFWALKDLNFSVKQGESLGIIGKNGSGKSTLLKILSRISSPTTGEVRISGRVASLLEVGTGFSEELTGRENIYLNGAILGMSQKEIKRKFDEIVAFSEVEKFIDTPVKHYSSGMYVRLAFAVAAHLESEILIVDEVLAVGDTQFQAKSLGKMSEVIKNEGRTILFVSHTMGSISQLCNRCLLLDQGKALIDSEDVDVVINSYQKSPDPSLAGEWTVEKAGTKVLGDIARVAITDETGDTVISTITNDTEAYMTIDLESTRFGAPYFIGYALYVDGGGLLFWSNPVDVGKATNYKNKLGKWRLMSKVPQILNQGRYRAEIIAMVEPKQWVLQPGTGTPSITFDVQNILAKPIFGADKRQGVFAPQNSWHIERK